MDYYTKKCQVHQAKARQQDSIVMLWNLVMLWNVVMLSGSEASHAWGYEMLRCRSA